MRRVLPFILLAIATLATYSGAFRNGFVFDDLPSVVENPVFRTDNAISVIFASDDAVGTGNNNPYYRPVTTLTFALDQALYGRNALGYHATNVLLHLAATFLLYALMARVSRRPAAALPAALLFAVHPAHAEPVAYISARADIVCGIWLASSFLLFLGWRDTGSRAKLACSIGMFAAAVFSKIIATMFPALLLLHALVAARDRRREVAAVIPYLAVVALFLAVRNDVLVVHDWGPGASLGVRVMNAGVILVKYLKNVLFPSGLRVFYDLPVMEPFSRPIVFSAWSILAAIAGISLYCARRRPAAVLGVAWFFICLFPVCGVVLPFYPPMADRYMYVPLFGLAFASMSLFDRVREQADSAFRVSAPAVVVVILAAGMSVTAASRVAAWGEPVRYWKTAIKDTPGKAYMLGELGNAYKEAGKYDEAIRSLEQAISSGGTSRFLHIDLAEIYLARGDFPGAERHFWRALDLDPGNVSVISALGDVYARSGRIEEARQCWESVLRRRPDEPTALAGLRSILSGRKGLPGRRDASAEYGTVD